MMVRAESAEDAKMPGTARNPASSAGNFPAKRPYVIPAKAGTQSGKQSRRHAAAFL